MGDCIIPREGVFAEVLTGGIIRPGDEIKALPLLAHRPFTAAVLTLSDKGYAGEREDQSGPLIQEILKGQGYEVIEKLLLPDGRKSLEKQLCRLADQRQVNLILTTGGTGFAERDPNAPYVISAPFCRNSSIFSRERRLTCRCQFPPWASPAIPKFSISFA